MMDGWDRGVAELNGDGGEVGTVHGGLYIHMYRPATRRSVTERL